MGNKNFFFSPQGPIMYQYPHRDDQPKIECVQDDSQLIQEITEERRLKNLKANASVVGDYELYAKQDPCIAQYSNLNLGGGNIPVHQQHLHHHQICKCLNCLANSHVSRNVHHNANSSNPSVNSLMRMNDMGNDMNFDRSEKLSNIMKSKRRMSVEDEELKDSSPIAQKPHAYRYGINKTNIKNLDKVQQQINSSGRNEFQNINPHPHLRNLNGSSQKFQNFGRKKEEKMKIQQKPPQLQHQQNNFNFNDSGSNSSRITNDKKSMKKVLMNKYNASRQRGLSGIILFYA
jgi:hypothetical protein